MVSVVMCLGVLRMTLKLGVLRMSAVAPEIPLSVPFERVLEVPRNLVASVRAFEILLAEWASSLESKCPAKRISAAGVEEASLQIQNSMPSSYCSV